METFIPGKFYRLVDRQGFINTANYITNREIAAFIEKLGNRFSVVASSGSFRIQEGSISKYSVLRVLNEGEREFFEEIVDDEVPLKQPNVPYAYTETEIKDTLKVAFEDDAFVAALKLLTAADAAHVLSLKFKGASNAGV
ncbi:hypothetical protein KNT87_gp006 [Erwinia phage Cronus]|uniref:Uncharacterized protein n=1 Tax=Erwinia phage Cronus TaxID=2163633 RepID=A0A2S1GM35_9CAUD|nr:hypothetical protein KNT87_gp006 [Erwinia phage Cronus]AWD90445.1 hypothetical protein [Erwinia phage Cronus]